MSQLKPSFVKDIRGAIQRSVFTEDDFLIELPSSGRILLKIVFLHKPSFIFLLVEDKKKESSAIEHTMLGGRIERGAKERIAYSIRVSPGDFKAEAEYEIDNIDDLLREIPKWCENIRSDLYALAPQVDPLALHKKQFEDYLNSVIKNPDDFFDDSELVAVDTRFDEMFEEIEKLKEQYSLTKSQLDTIQKDFNEFKQSARAYPKGIWAKITGNKLIKTTGQIINSSEGRKFIFQSIKQMLGMDNGS